MSATSLSPCAVGSRTAHATSTLIDPASPAGLARAVPSLRDAATSKRARDGAESSSPARCRTELPAPGVIRAHVLAQLDAPLSAALKHCAVAAARLPSMDPEHARPLNQALGFVMRTLVDRAVAAVAADFGAGSGQAATAGSPQSLSSPGPGSVRNTLLSRLCTAFSPIGSAGVLGNTDVARELTTLAGTMAATSKPNLKHHAAAMLLTAASWSAVSAHKQAAEHAVFGAVRAALPRATWDAAVDCVQDLATGGTGLPSKVADAVLSGIATANDRRLGFTALGASQQGTPIFDRMLSPKTGSFAGWSPQLSPQLSPQMSPRLSPHATPTRAVGIRRIADAKPP